MSENMKTGQDRVLTYDETVRAADSGVVIRFLPENVWADHIRVDGEWFFQGNPQWTRNTYAETQKPQGRAIYVPRSATLTDILGPEKPPEAIEFPGEAEAILLAIDVGSRYGYGNVIDRLKKAWAGMLVRRHKMSQDAADRAAGLRVSEKPPEPKRPEVDESKWRLYRVYRNERGNLGFDDEDGWHGVDEAARRPGFVVYCFWGPKFDGWRHTPYIYERDGFHSITSDPDYTCHVATWIRSAKEVEGEQ